MSFEFLSFEPRNQLIGSANDVIKKNAKPTLIMTSSTKNPKPKIYNFKKFWTTRLSPFSKGLNNSLAQSAGKLWTLAKTAKVTFNEIWSFIQFLVFEP